MNKPFSLPEAMAPYLQSLNTPPDAGQAHLIDVAEGMPAGGMKVSHDASVMLTVLVQAIRPAFAIEIGTFIGYSSLAIAKGLPDKGRLLCCDINDQWTKIAREQWAAAGVADRIELRLGPAIDTLRALPAEPLVDFAFIDADKTGYASYYEELLGRLSGHGVIAVDNTMWSGRVLDADDTSADTVALREFNELVARDERTVNVTVPIGDGITLIAHAMERPTPDPFPTA